MPVKTGFLYDDVFLRHMTPQWHPESKERLISIVGALKKSPLFEVLEHISPLKASFQEVGMVHGSAYINRMKTFTGYADPDTYVSEGSLDAALYAAGAAIKAVEECKSGEIQRAFCAVRPPGHHAEAERAMGFCIFNNVAIGAKYAQKAGYKRVFIVDFDVHHGNGTQHAFETDASVFYFSTHQYPHYPGTGSASEKGVGNVLNIPLPPDAGDAEYEKAYGETLPGVIGDFKPDIMLVSAGYDIHVQDPLSDIRVTDDGIGIIVKGILSSAPSIPAVFCLEGGYSLEALSRSVLTTLKMLVEYEG